MILGIGCIQHCTLEMNVLNRLLIPDKNKYKKPIQWDWIFCKRSNTWPATATVTRFCSFKSFMLSFRELSKFPTWAINSANPEPKRHCLELTSFAPNVARQYTHTKIYLQRKKQMHSDFTDEDESNSSLSSRFNHCLVQLKSLLDSVMDIMKFPDSRNSS